MATFSTYFSEYFTGSPPDDWTERWDNTNTPWSIVSVLGAVGGNALQFTIPSGSLFTRRALTWDDVGSVSGDLDVVAKFRITASDGTPLPYPALLHVSGSASVENAYVARLSQPDLSGSAFDAEIVDYTSGSGVILADTTKTGSLSLNEWFYARLQRSSTTIRIRFWIFGAAQPTTWDASVSDSSHSSGNVGVSNFENTDTVQWNYVGIGTGVDLAPMPNVTFSRPDSDVTVGGWEEEPTVLPTTLFDKVNEVTPDEATTFIQSDADPVNQTCEIGLATIGDPLTLEGHTLGYRLLADPGNTIVLTVSLIQGVTVIASKPESGIGTQFENRAIQLTETQAGNITDYSDLRVRFSADGSGFAAITWVAFQVPADDPPGPTPVPSFARMIRDTNTVVGERRPVDMQKKIKFVF